MSRKSGGLSFPTNPLASMRGLQDLDADVPAGSRRGGAREAPTPSAGVERSTRPRSRKAHRPRGASVSEPGVDSPAHPPPPADPMGEAVRALLEKPYTADPQTGPFTVSTVKIPTEVWERLGWVAKFTGRTKQELITEALREHFRRTLRDGELTRP